MSIPRIRENAVLAVGICLGLALLGWLLGSSLIRFKEFERTVTVKGLAEREVAADVALWPVTFTAADNDLNRLYDTLGTTTDKVEAFLAAQSFTDQEITVAPPTVNDKLAQQWGGGGDVGLRYTATRTVTVYTDRVDAVRAALGELAELGAQGVVLSGGDYDTRIRFVFTGLNELKPAMVEEATRNAREVAEKFADDSQSRLGKIKQARQGVFSIENRDANTPHIKKVRVVSTVEYYLAD
ncbi:MAG: SIMPL domain-containing protein [bacterium]|nr:SIMPL domain-containing protein [bacterium]